MVVETNQSGIEDLPNEIQLQILDHLDFEGRCTASKVCRLWNSLAFSGRFLNRVCLRLNITEGNLKLVCATLNSSVRNYRHIAVNFNNEPITMMDQFAQAVGENDALESLSLSGMNRVEPVQLLLLLDCVPYLKRLYLLAAGMDRLPETSFLDHPEESPMWPAALSLDSSVKLLRLNNLSVLVPARVAVSSKSFTHKFPNLTELHLTCQHPSNATLFDYYRDQLEKVSIFKPSALFVTAFCSISFTKLRSLYVDRLELHDQLLVAKCINFFRNSGHSGTLQQLVLHPKFMMRTPIFSTICANCSALRVLELSLDYMDGDALKEVTNLQNLQNLSLQGTAYFRESPRWPHQIRTLGTVRVSGSRFPIGLLEFIADIAPNLDSLTMEDVENPEELFRVLPALMGTIRRFALIYSEGFERPPSCHPSGLLRNMDHLESYHLQRAVIKHGIQGWLQDAPQLRRVVLTDCGTLTDTHLVILTTNCPKLEWLQLKRCSLVTIHGLEEFRSRIPQCKVDTDVK